MPSIRLEMDVPNPTRHSGMLLAGIQTHATTGLPYGWIPAKRIPE
jgi:hypothetical protein